MKQTLIDDPSATMLLDSRSARLLVLQHQADALFFDFKKTAENLCMSKNEKRLKMRDLYRKLEEIITKRVILLRKSY